MGVDGQRHATDAVWTPVPIVGPKTGLDGYGKQKISIRHRGLNPEPSSP
jgi:hypothetical protein